MKKENLKILFITHTGLIMMCIIPPCKKLNTQHLSTSNVKFIDKYILNGIGTRFEILWQSPLSENCSFNVAELV